VSISVFDLFKIGVGPSSSHTVGPMVAANRFVRELRANGVLGQVASVRVELFGSLGATGHGHGSVPALMLGLMGYDPETVDPQLTQPTVHGVRAFGRLALLEELTSGSTSTRTSCSTCGSGWSFTPTR